LNAANGAATDPRRVPVKYLLTIYTDESTFADASPEDATRMTDAYFALNREMEQAGVLLGAEGLQGISTATTVRVRDGDRLLTDGPFAETRETLAGFYLVDVDDLDAAISWAAKIPGAAWGAVEVRPVRVFDRDRAAA
jgi:hypothetical protein